MEHWPGRVSRLENNKCYAASSRIKLLLSLLHWPNLYLVVRTINVILSSLGYNKSHYCHSFIIQDSFVIMHFRICRFVYFSKNCIFILNIRFVLIYFIIWISIINPSYKGPSWSWSYGNSIYNYICNKCISPLKLWVRILFIARCIRYSII